MECFDKLKFEEVSEETVKSFIKEIENYDKENGTAFANILNINDGYSYRAELKTPSNRKIVVYTGGISIGDNENYDVVIFYKGHPIVDFDDVSKEKVNEIIEKFW